MAFYTKLPVYRDSYQLALKVFEYSKNFPREYTFTLGQGMRRDALQLLRCIYRTNKHKNRAEQLEVFLDEFELLKLYVRASNQGLSIILWTNHFVQRPVILQKQRFITDISQYPYQLNNALLLLRMTAHKAESLSHGDRSVI